MYSDFTDDWDTVEQDLIGDIIPNFGQSSESQWPV